MQFLIRFDVHQPEDMSNREFIEMWDREADAALEAMDAGALTHLWKVSGQRVVFGVARAARTPNPSTARSPACRSSRRSARPSTPRRCRSTTTGPSPPT